MATGHEVSSIPMKLAAVLLMAWQALAENTLTLQGDSDAEPTSQTASGFDSWAKVAQHSC